MSEDLWGEIPTEKEIKLPVTILKEQATLLGEKTNKILEAKVDSIRLATQDQVGHSLKIIAPALSNYNYEVLSIYHPPIFVYPVTIIYQVNKQRYQANCNDENSFGEKLKEILSSDTVHKAIVALISQSKATVA